MDTQQIDLVFQCPSTDGFLVIRPRTKKGKTWITQSQNDLRGYTVIQATHKVAFMQSANQSGLRFVDLADHVT
jgi:hypothetical protein